MRRLIGKQSVGSVGECARSCRKFCQPLSHETCPHVISPVWFMQSVAATGSIDARNSEQELQLSGCFCRLATDLFVIVWMTSCDRIGTVEWVIIVLIVRYMMQPRKFQFTCFLLIVWQNFKYLIIAGANFEIKTFSMNFNENLFGFRLQSYHQLWFKQNCKISNNRANHVVESRKFTPVS